MGKRGYGKSYTLGVLAEELARAEGVSPVVLDLMGVFSTLAEPAEGQPVDAAVVADPSVPAAALAPRAWCDLVGLAPESGPGALVWHAAAERETLAGMVDHVADADATRSARRAAENHLSLAESWGVFDPDGLTAADVNDGRATVVDLSGLDRAPMNAVASAVARSLYDQRVADGDAPLPWLLVDEAHVFFDGIAGPAFRTVLTRGRQPGVSLVVATQRPSALPEVAVSQADLVVAHRLTARADQEALARARPTYVQGSLAERMPTERGTALVVDDSTESVRTIWIRERDTPHGGESPRAVSPE